MTLIEMDLRIESIANGGDGVAHLPDGRAVFIPFTLPGEVVRTRLTDEKPGVLRGEVIRIINPSQARITPLCKHFGTCGGCHFQHMDYPVQLEIKEAIIRDVFSRVGGLSNIPMQPIQPCPQPWNYRNHVQYHVDENGSLGYQRPNSHSVIPIQECHIAQTPLEDLRDRIFLDPIADISRVSLREGIDNELMVVFESDGNDLPELELDLPASVIHSSPPGQVVLAGNDHMFMEINHQIFKVSAGSFFQVNSKVAENMVEHVVSLLPSTKINCLVDLFCGVGLFSAFLAVKTERLIGIESSPSACMDFAENLVQYDHIELFEGITDSILPALDIQPGVIIADPPRAGLGIKTLEAITRLSPDLFIYVSCDPATLARDSARLLRSGYQCQTITPFDMFPQTCHIETISVFVRLKDRVLA